MASSIAYRERATECLRLAGIELDQLMKAKWKIGRAQRLNSSHTVI